MMYAIPYLGRAMPERVDSNGRHRERTVSLTIELPEFTYESRKVR
jgi:hypothetical protein